MYLSQWKFVVLEHCSIFCYQRFAKFLLLSCYQCCISQYLEGGWIQKVRPSAYQFPKSEKALTDAIEAAGPTLGPILISMSEYLMSSFNETYQSRCVWTDFYVLFLHLDFLL